MIDPFEAFGPCKRRQVRMLKIEIANQQGILDLPENDLRRAVRRTLEAERVRHAVVSLAVVDDQTMRALHRQWLNDDSVTDVLSFPLSEEPGVWEGEVVVNAEQAALVGPQFGWSAHDELLLYVVHGLLHLCGYDDRRPVDAERMRQRQAALLTAWGVHPAENGRGSGYRVRAGGTKGSGRRGRSTTAGASRRIGQKGVAADSDA